YWERKSPRWRAPSRRLAALQRRNQTKMVSRSHAEIWGGCNRRWRKAADELMRADTSEFSARQLQASGSTQHLPRASISARMRMKIGLAAIFWAPPYWRPEGFRRVPGFFFPPNPTPRRRLPPAIAPAAAITLFRRHCEALSCDHRTACGLSRRAARNKSR